MTSLVRVALLLLLAVLLVGCPPMRTPVTTDSNQAALPIAGRDGEGRFMQLSDYRGKVVLLDFWFSACKPCRLFNQREREIVKRYQNRPFVVLGVNADPSPQRLLETQKTDQLETRSWWDGQRGPIATQWGVEAFPTIYLIDHLGHIRFHTQGLSPAALESMETKIEQLVLEAEEAARSDGK
jgi:thiol-disulfide isomerase/thioredoxin